MAYTLVNANRGTNAVSGNNSTIGVSPTVSLAAGNLAILIVAWIATTKTLSSVADNHTSTANVWAVDVQKQETVLGGNIAICSCILANTVLTTDTITATFSGLTSAQAIGVSEFSGSAASAALDKTATNAFTSSSNPTTGTTATTTGGADLNIGAYGSGTMFNGDAFTMGTDGNSHTVNNMNHGGTASGTALSWEAVYFIESADAAFVDDVTDTTAARRWVTAIATYKPAASAAAATASTLALLGVG